MVDPFSHAVLILQQHPPTFPPYRILGPRLVVFLLHSYDAGVPGLPIPRLLKIFFFQSDRPTQYQETHSTLNEKKRGWP